MITGPSDLRAQADTASAHLPALMLAAERLAAMIAPGAHGLRRAGPGEDFWQYRPAGVGDGARSIDWRRSARSDAQFVRDREAQTAQTVQIWLSPSPDMDFTGGSDRPTKAERGQVLALALAMLLLRGGEKVGLLGQSTGTGRIQADRLAEALCMPRDTDFPVAELRPDRQVIVIADFLADPQWIADALNRAAGLGTHGCLLQILDPDEENFPFEGAVEFRAPNAATRHHSRDAQGLRQAYLTRLAKRRDWLHSQSAQAGWQFTHHVTSDDPAQVLGRIWAMLGPKGAH
ncbi:DUF58 domain-containing protein [Paracoccus indicus]|uniref:DUF58 domain-containing protein n=1 Tax=Paracoccus indicus TaxID=2079229 RepID=UPI000D387A00|nr:DUF58 domain-containing protein [Paracoccus indicus]